MAARQELRLSNTKAAGMLIDTHCHIDRYSSPEGVVTECVNRNIRVIAVTYLPSHFSIATERLKGVPLVSAALGIHPLSATEGLRELSAFKRMAPHANYIGEIGLDSSAQGKPSMAIQERVFEEVLRSISDRQRFVTLHSRGAEISVLHGLRRHGIRSAVFHWFSGSRSDLDAVLADGHLVSINPAMLSSASGQRVIAHAPQEQVLVESDGPFTKHQGRECTPSDIAVVYRAMAERWAVPMENVIARIKSNFDRIAPAR